jgi:hypothetical protein
MQGQLEVEGRAAPDESSRRGATLRSQEVERAKLVVAAEDAPGRSGRRIIDDRQLGKARDTLRQRHQAQWLN